MTEIEPLHRKRGAVKAKLTLFKGYVDSLQNACNSTPEMILSRVQAIELNDRINAALLLLRQFDDIQSGIEENCTVASLEKEYQARQEFETSYYSIIAIARHLLESKSPPAAQSGVHVGTPGGEDQMSDTTSTRGSNNAESQGVGIKLPTIDLPKFSGEFNTWLEFRDTFESLIHSNSSINSIQKFHYLRAALRGASAQIIESLEFSAANYTTAWDLLQKRYNNERLLVHNHVKAIFTIEPITRESAESIRRLIDSVSKHLRSLSSLGQPILHWDTLLIHIITSKLDINTGKEWEKARSGDSVPTFETFIDFLTSRADLLETIESIQSKPNVSKSREPSKNQVRSLVTTTNQCAMCSAAHTINTCPDFLALGIDDRFANVKKLKLCLNCLKRGHFSGNCTAGLCRQCKAKHHTLLHRDKSAKESATTAEPSNVTVAFTPNVLTSTVLLSTALVNVTNAAGNLIRARALLDPGSQSSFITNRLHATLKLPSQTVSTLVSGINQATIPIQSSCKMQISSLQNGFATELNCLIIERITSQLPNFTVKEQRLSIPRHIKLADPTFHQPGEIDILLGSDIFWKLLCIGQIPLDGPVLQKTRLGWIVGGPLSATSIASTNVHCNFLETVSLEQQVAKFWDMEELQHSVHLSEEDKVCEQHFATTVDRDRSGRFVVSIPFKESPEALGESLSTARKRLMCQERRLSRDPSLKRQYHLFMEEYQSLNHMTKVDTTNLSSLNLNYLPHHGVQNTSSSTTKLRVVFDGSSPTSNGKSLNSLQMTGPTLQPHLFSILVRFRMAKFILSADIEKMYRQILIKPEQRHLQSILWREDPSNPIETFMLNTVTYGTTSAPYLAIRCLFELANECEACNV